jgi:hypothetical protein
MIFVIEVAVPWLLVVDVLDDDDDDRGGLALSKPLFASLVPCCCSFSFSS